MSKQDPSVIRHTELIPYDQGVGIYRTYEDMTMPGNAVTSPWTFTGWVDETLSWKETCYLGAVLNPPLVAEVKGPDALKFMQDYFVNGFSKFKVGTGRHGIICNEDGYIMADGVLLRLAEDHFQTFFMSPVTEICFSKGDYNATCETLTGQRFMYQIAGPRALEVIEQACQEDLHDLKFMHFRDATINGKNVRVLRMGMAGALAYEVHGVTEDSMEVYSHLWEVGQKYGMRRLGWQAYCICNHTENGFPQGMYHYTYPWQNDEVIAQVMQLDGPAQPFRGSMGDEFEELHYVTPYDNGWGSRVKFDHDFQGRAALEKIVQNPPRRMVTLEWNEEDCIDVMASIFRDQTYDIMALPYYETYDAEDALYMDKVLNDEGRVIGGSSGRVYTYYYKKMISLCSIEKEYAEEGTEVTIVWGEGELKKNIRAKVARFPYLDLPNNNSFDVETIPHFQKA